MSIGYLVWRTFFFTRRSADTQELVLNGLVRATAHYEKSGGGEGKLSGTSNVHFAHRFAHESSLPVTSWKRAT